MVSLANITSKFLPRLHKAIILFEGAGLYSSLRVTKTGERINFFTGRGYLQSSYDPSKPITGNHWDWYLCAPIFSGNFIGRLSNVLVLGLGGGSVVKLYNRAYQVRKVVGVEIDPAIIKISKEFFNLNDRNLEIIKADILNYITTASYRFDLIILDAFKENRSEPKSLITDFLKTCRQALSNNGVFVVNRVNFKSHLAENKNLTITLKKLYKNVYALNIRYNIFYFCTNSPQAPDSLGLLKKSILELADSNKELSFMKHVNSIKISII